MRTLKQVCIQDYRLEALNGDCLVLTRGEEYITSLPSKGRVTVFTNFWVKVPARLFAGAKSFTATGAAAWWGHAQVE